MNNKPFETMIPVLMLQKKLIKNKVEFTGELRESYEKLRFFGSVN